MRPGQKFMGWDVNIRGKMDMWQMWRQRRVTEGVIDHCADPPEGVRSPWQGRRCMRRGSLGQLACAGVADPPAPSDRSLSRATGLDTWHKGGNQRHAQGMPPERAQAWSAQGCDTCHLGEAGVGSMAARWGRAEELTHGAPCVRGWELRRNIDHGIVQEDRVPNTIKRAHILDHNRIKNSI